MTEALTDVDRNSLLAERAEAEAQLRAAEATLGNVNGRTASGEERGVATPNGDDMDQIAGQEAPELDVAALRRAAAGARAADEVLARAASEATERPLPSETPVGSDAGQLGTAESSLARALEIREELPAAWRRLVGALISATGMAIVIGALGWNVYWLLVPIALIAIMTVDLRVAGQTAREASAEAARELATVGVTGAEGLDRIRSARARIEEAESRLAAARAARDAAYARFEELAPGHLPSEEDDVIADYEAERAAREAAGAAPPLVEPEASEPASTPAEPLPAPEALPVPAVAVEWWFEEKPSEVGSAPAEESTPARPPPAPVRALAERLSAEGREALARIEAQLAALDRVELAKRSLEWHQARSGQAEQAE
jgi:hypothetical protein